MCAYRVHKGEVKGPGRVAAAILAATLFGLILVGFASSGRASEEVGNPVVFGSCPVRVWEGSSFSVEVSSTDSWDRIGFYLVFEPVTAGASDYLSRSGVYATPNPGILTFRTLPDDLAEGDETFVLKVGSNPSQIGSGTDQQCAVTIIDDDMMQVSPVTFPGVGSEA